MATIVKLTRALMIVPVCLGFASSLKWYRSKQQGRNKGNVKENYSYGSSLWFIVASILSSLSDLVPKVVLPVPKGPCLTWLYGHGSWSESEARVFFGNSSVQQEQPLLLVGLHLLGFV